LLSLFCGCGYVGDPLPPLRNIPSSIEDLAAVQRGGRLIVQFTLPATTTEGTPIPAGLRAELRVGASISPFTPETWAAQAREYHGPVEKGHAAYEIPVGDWAGKPVTIGARAIGANGKDGGWSFVNLDVVPPPEKPAGVRAEVRADGTLLRWQGEAGRYRVLRRGPEQKEFALVETVDAPEWLDQTAEYGKAYTYLIQRVVGTAESELSEPLTVTARDTFPPAAPAGLRGVAATQTIELTWERNGEPDLAGYRVYRAAGDGAFVKVGDTSVLPAYSDKGVEPGKTYRYRITAVDTAGNESAPSTAVAASL
jgi:hypothetical protein